MSLHSVPSMMAMERSRTLLEEADAYRRASEMRHSSSFEQGRLGHAVARLRNAAVIRIRPIRSDDSELLNDAFERLSARSRQLRFLAPKNSLSPSELRYFTDVDHFDHEALVAVSRVDGRGLGVARYIRLHDDAESADVAVTVVDEWQGRGLGTALATRLAARAREAGVHRFVALVSNDNTGARRLLANLCASVSLIGRDADVLSYELRLNPSSAERRRHRPSMLGPVPSGCA